LIMICADITTDVLTLVKIIVVHIFLHDPFFADISAWSHYIASPASLIFVVQNVGVCHVLSMYASASFNHW
jgi:hypothetical protein